MKKRSFTICGTILALSAALLFGSGLLAAPANAKPSHQPPPVHNSAHMTVHHDNGSHNTNVNVNVNNHGGPKPAPSPHHDSHHDTANLIAGAITGLAVGAIVTAASMPPACKDVVVNNIAYRQCGADWYQPYYSGTDVQYMVVAPPR